MNVSVLVCTYGGDHWRSLALSRAVPSTRAQGADEVVVHHEPEGTIATCRNNAANTATGDILIYAGCCYFQV